MRKGRIKLELLSFFALADLCGLLAGFAAAYYIRFLSGLIEVTKSYSVTSYLNVLPLVVFIWIFWLHSVGCYNFQERAFNLQLLKKIVRANIMAVVTIVAFHFFTRSQEFSRITYPLAAVTCTCGIGLARFVLDRILARLRHAGRLPSAPVLILGTGPLGRNIAQRIRDHAFLGMKVMGFATTASAEVGSTISGFPVVSDFAGIAGPIRELEVSEVIVAQPELAPQDILDFAIECEKQLVSVRVVPNLLEAMLVEQGVEQIDGIPLFGL
ncbi:MAG: hypothetical protein K1X53_06210, partial [Candidatus Sumerlaeaceae bacterium]|nr:hypothetical protein [Candidatus Sumerlaeaceae bacterium]